MNPDRLGPSRSALRKHWEVVMDNIQELAQKMALELYNSVDKYSHAEEFMAYGAKYELALRQIVERDEPASEPDKPCLAMVISIEAALSHLQVAKELIKNGR